MISQYGELRPTGYRLKNCLQLPNDDGWAVTFGTGEGRCTKRNSDAKRRVVDVPVLAADVQLFAGPVQRPSTHRSRQTSEVPLQPSVSVEWSSILTQPPAGPAGSTQPTTARHSRPLDDVQRAAMRRSGHILQPAPRGRSTSATLEWDPLRFHAAGRKRRPNVALVLGNRLVYRSVVCLSVCDVGVLWPNGWTDQDETWHGVDLGRGHIVLDGNPTPPHRRGTAPNFRPMSVVAKRMD